jgi:hypothetical protein
MEKNLLTSSLCFRDQSAPEGIENLKLAIASGRLEVVKGIYTQLAASEKNPAIMLNKEDGSGKTLLFYAAYQDAGDIALYLMINGSNIFKKDGKQRNLFHYLAYVGRV